MHDKENYNYHPTHVSHNLCYRDLYIPRVTQSLQVKAFINIFYTNKIPTRVNSNFHVWASFTVRMGYRLIHWVDIQFLSCHFDGIQDTHVLFEKPFMFHWWHLFSVMYICILSHSNYKYITIVFKRMSNAMGFIIFFIKQTIIGLDN